MAYKGKYKVKNIEKYVGDPTKAIYRSLWERNVCKKFDHDPNVIRWGIEPFFIPYFSSVDKKNHKYFIDFYAEIRNKNGEINKFLIEVKPHAQTLPPKSSGIKQRFLRESKTYAINQCKWTAARAMCKRKGWKFLLFTEKNCGFGRK